VSHLKILKQRLSGLKSKSTKVLYQVYEGPPDPRRAMDGNPISSAGIYAIHEVKEETTPGMLYEKQLQTFTCSYARIQGSSFEAQNEPIKGEGMGAQYPFSTTYQTNHCQKLQARCSTLWLMAEGDKNPTMPEAEENLQTGVSLGVQGRRLLRLVKRERRNSWSSTCPGRARRNGHSTWQSDYSCPCCSSTPSSCSTT
jgi:hypothetical protein